MSAAYKGLRMESWYAVPERLPDRAKLGNGSIEDVLSVNPARVSAEPCRMSPRASCHPRRSSIKSARDLVSCLHRRYIPAKPSA